MSTVLYHERQDEWGSKPGQDARVTDYVEVWVRLYEAVLVITTLAMVDREIVVEKREAFAPWNETNAAWIRRGIAAFDEALAAHPTLGKG